MAKTITVQQIADALTDALKADPAAVNSLFQLRVPCGQAIVDHPTIVCNQLSSVCKTPMLTLVGLLQCVANLTGEDKRLASVWEACHIVGFKAVDRSSVDHGPPPDEDE